MLRKTFLFTSIGFIWLFLYSIPMGQGKNLYNVAYYYIVDTRPVHWLISKVQGGYSSTLDAAIQDDTPEVFEKMRERVSNAKRNLEKE